MASKWNIPMFGFVGQSPKMDNFAVYDTYIKLVPPLKRIGEVLIKTLDFFGWTHIAIIGGGAESNTWDKVDELWKSVEAQLRGRFNVTAQVKFDTANLDLVRENVKHVSKAARSKPLQHCSVHTLRFLYFLRGRKTFSISSYDELKIQAIYVPHTMMFLFCLLQMLHNHAQLSKIH